MAAAESSRVHLVPSGDGGVFVPSSLWIDQPDFRDRLARRFDRGEVSREEMENLVFFADNGYLVLRLAADDRMLDSLQESVERFWRDRPADLAYAYDGPARRMTWADESRERRSRYRLHDIHSHCPAALELYLERRVTRYVDLILGGDGVAIQSLYFEYGSQQLLHRDPVVVPVGSPGHLVAAWIALEDISPDCGPLVYVPGSHRLPYFELAPGEYRYDSRQVPPARVEEGLRWEEEQYRRHGLEKKAFTPRRGEVLLWHASLTHGGSEVRDEQLTRKSFVTHFSTASTYPERSITIAEPEADGEVSRVWTTREILVKDGRRGFQNPLLGAPRG